MVVAMGRAAPDRLDDYRELVISHLNVQGHLRINDIIRMNQEFDLNGYANHLYNAQERQFLHIEGREVRETPRQDRRANEFLLDVIHEVFLSVHGDDLIPLYAIEGDRIVGPIEKVMHKGDAYLHLGEAIYIQERFVIDQVTFLATNL